MSDRALVEAGLATIGAASRACDLHRNYVAGNHELTYTSSKLKSKVGKALRRYAENLIAPILETRLSRLNLTSFSVASGDVDAAVALIEQVQQDVLFEQVEDEVYTESLTTGKGAFILYWRDPSDDAAALQMEVFGADQVAVGYDPLRPRVVAWATKLWRSDLGFLRLNLYLPDRIVKYRSPEAGKVPSDVNDWLELTDEEVVNPYGLVPCVPFVVTSEVPQLVPVQDAYNQTVVTLLNATEYVAIPQRWATGAEARTDEWGREVKVNVDTPGALMKIPGKEAKVGQFEAANLTQLIAVTERFAKAMTRVGTTPDYMLNLGDSASPTSGEELRIRERAVTSKVVRIQKRFTPRWEQLFEGILAMYGVTATLKARWEEAAPLTQKEKRELAAADKALGVPANRYLKHLDYSDDEIDAMVEQMAVDEQARLDAERTVFTAGLTAV